MLNDNKYLEIEHKNKNIIQKEFLRNLDDGKEERNKLSITIISCKTLCVEILKIFNSKRIYHRTILTRINRSMSIEYTRKV